MWPAKRCPKLFRACRESDPQLFEIYGRVALTGTPERFETYVEALGMWFAISVYSPRPEYFVAIFDVITERKRAEAALRDSEERFRTMANAIPQLAWTARSDGYIFWYNQRWYDYTGTTPADMEGWGWQSVHDPEVLPQVLEQWRASIATGRPFDMVFPLRGADGQFRQFLTRVMPMKDADGEVMQWFGTNTDITERQQAEEALRRSYQRLDLLAETASQPSDSVSRRSGGCHLPKVWNFSTAMPFSIFSDEKEGRLHLNACAGIPDEEVRRLVAGLRGGGLRLRRPGRLPDCHRGYPRLQ